jgi:hypothetical protein
LLARYIACDICRIDKKTNNIGIAARFYEFEVNDKFNEVIKNKELIKKDYVKDAFLTGESWILKPTKPIKSTIIIIHEDLLECPITFQSIRKLKKCPIIKINYTTVDCKENLLSIPNNKDQN